MNIAYLIQCHKNPKQINMLTEELTRGNADVYIHLDQKSNGIRREIHTNARIVLLPEEASVPVFWGTFSQCEATLALLRKAVSSGKHYDYFWLISGQDLPLKSQQEIEEILEEANGSDFIEIMQDTASGYGRFEKRNAVYHIPYFMSRSVLSKIVKRVWYMFTGGMEHTFTVFKRKCPFDGLYYGSSWWCFSKDTSLKIMKILEENENIKGFFMHSGNPDESFFHSLIMSLKEEKNIRRPLLYLVWEPRASSPKTFTVQDLDRLQAADDCCFARKFDMETDRRIIDEIYTMLRERSV